MRAVTLGPGGGSPYRPDTQIPERGRTRPVNRRFGGVRKGHYPAANLQRLRDALRGPIPTGTSPLVATLSGELAPVYPAEMADDVLTVLITGLVYTFAAALLVAIVFANLYAILHAWRSDRIGWCIVLAALFPTGGGLATAVYLFVHQDEPMPPGHSPRSSPI